MSNPKNTAIKKFGRLPLILAASLSMTAGLVFASSVAPQTPERAQPVQPGQAQTHQVQTRQAQPGQRASGNTGSQPRQQSGTNLQHNPFLLDGHGGRGGHSRHSSHGDFGGRGAVEQGGLGQPGTGQRGPRAAIAAAVAKSLGLSEAALRQELRGGKTIAQVAQARGVSTASVHVAAVSALQTRLAAQVKAGRVQQAQATQMVQQAQADANFGLGFGGHKRGGQRGGPRDGAPSGQLTPNGQSSPSTVSKP
ncbi:hypothetical protein [Deinococcus sp.]|uniref:hypothetical protein n=1 Tax=Deinococcus sp. TaxID=47478 RepID=UPI0025BBD798|nr:hypothetical protein [Deinococcus sp.]